MSDLNGRRRQFLITANAGLLLGGADVGPLAAAEFTAPAPPKA